MNIGLGLSLGLMLCAQLYGYAVVYQEQATLAALILPLVAFVVLVFFLGRCIKKHHSGLGYLDDDLEPWLKNLMCIFHVIAIAGLIVGAVSSGFTGEAMAGILILTAFSSLAAAVAYSDDAHYVAVGIGIVLTGLFGAVIVGCQENELDPAVFALSVFVIVAPVMVSMAILILNDGFYSNEEKASRMRRKDDLKVLNNKLSLQLRERIDDLRLKAKCGILSERTGQPLSRKQLSAYILSNELLIQKISTSGILDAERELENLFGFCSEDDFYLEDSDELMSEILRIGQGNSEVGRFIGKQIERRNEVAELLEEALSKRESGSGWS